MGDGLVIGSPRAPAAPAPTPAPSAPAAAPAPAGTPAVPQRAVIHDPAFLRDLEERTLEDLAVGQAGDHGAAGAAGFAPGEGRAEVAPGRLTGADAGGGAAGDRDGEQRGG